MFAGREASQERPVFARAEPDDEYDYPKPELDPFVIDREGRDFTEEEEEEDEEDG